MKTKVNKPYFNVTAGIIRRQGMILISKRPVGSHLEGLWEFPGGKQEQDETLEECLAREINEELGIKISHATPLITIEHEYNTKIIALHAFCCEYIEGDPGSMEGQEIKWIVPEDLLEYSFPPPDAKIIEAIQSCGISP